MLQEVKDRLTGHLKIAQDIASDIKKDVRSTHAPFLVRSNVRFLEIKAKKSGCKSLYACVERVLGEKYGVFTQCVFVESIQSIDVCKIRVVEKYIPVYVYFFVLDWKRMNEDFLFSFLENIKIQADLMNCLFYFCLIVESGCFFLAI